MKTRKKAVPAAVPSPPEHQTAFLARWANVAAILNTLDREISSIEELGNLCEDGIGPFLGIDRARVRGIALDIHDLSTSVLILPLLGSVDFIDREQRRDRLIGEGMAKIRAKLLATAKGGAK